MDIKNHLLNLQPSSTLAINEKTRELESKGSKVYKFGFGQSPFPIPSDIVEELAYNASKKEYLPSKGLLELRIAIAKNLKSKKYLFEQNDIIIGPGTKELMFLLQIAFDGEIILPIPSWVSYFPQAIINKNKVHFLKTNFEDKWHLTENKLKEISDKIGNKKKLIIMNYPNNPSGTNPKKIEDLSNWLKKNNFIVLADEIYSDLNFQDNYSSISHFYPEGTIVSNGLSKWCGAGGWRLGFFAIPNQFKKLNTTISNLATETFSAVSAPIQYAAIKAYNSNQDDYLSKSKNILKKIALEAYKKFNTNKIKVIMPDGGFYIMPDFSELLKNRFKSSVDMCNQLLKDTGVAVLPGCDFGFPKDKLVFRLSYVDFDGKKFLNSVSKDVNINDEHLRKFAPKIIEGIDKIINWSNKMSK